MKRSRFLCILIFFTATAHAQLHQYTRAEIKHVADSVMRSFVGADVFRHCINELNTDDFVYYRYTDKKGRIRHRELPVNEHKYTRGDFRDVEVWYTVRYPYPKCAVCDTVRGETCVVIGRGPRLAKSPDISFIPDYVWENDSCRHTIRHYLPRGRHIHAR